MIDGLLCIWGSSNLSELLPRRFASARFAEGFKQSWCWVNSIRVTLRSTKVSWMVGWIMFPVGSECFRPSVAPRFLNRTEKFLETNLRWDINNPLQVFKIRETATACVFMPSTQPVLPISYKRIHGVVGVTSGNEFHPHLSILSVTNGDEALGFLVSLRAHVGMLCQYHQRIYSQMEYRKFAEMKGLNRKLSGLSTEKALVWTAHKGKFR